MSRPRTTPEVVPVPPPRVGTGNQFREPPGTSGTTLFQPLAGFLQSADNDPPVEWLLPELVPASGSVLVVSPPNVGKTWLALVVAKAAAAQDRPVFIVEEEGSRRGFAARFRSLAIPPEAPISVAHLQGVRLDNRRTLQALCGGLRAATRPVLELDPLAMLSDADENDTAEATRLTRAFAELRRANEAALLVVLHHTSKAGGRGGGSAIHAARGSSVFSGWFDAQLNLQGLPSPPGSGRVAFNVEITKMREAERGSPRLVTISLGSGEVEIGPAAEAPPDESHVSAVRKLLEASDEPLSKNEICKRVRARREAVLQAIAAIEPECDQDPAGRLALRRDQP